MSSTAFGKITAVYGQIDENGLFVRKWPAPKNTDYGQNGQKQLFVRKILEVSTSVLRTNAPNSRFLSVNLHHNGQKFTDKSPENEGLSVKCVLLTDKSAKNIYLSVKFE